MVVPAGLDGIEAGGAELPQRDSEKHELGRHEWFVFATRAKGRFFSIQSVTALVCLDNAVVVIEGMML
jgi:hypothetical protein